MEWNVAEWQRTVFDKMHVEVPRHARALDLGCGDGRDAQWFAERARETVGLDIVESPRWKQIHQTGLTFRVADAQALPFSDAEFDLVFLKDVLHHAADPTRVLREAARVCAAGGSIYVVEGNRFNPIFYLHMTLIRGHQHFRRPAFQALVRQVFPSAQFIRFEAHVYPLQDARLLRLVHLAENAIAATPLLERLASYNGAIAVSRSSSA
jgi:ubiquinone/menaquinone biosynthesis C-methylase UbiE